MTDRIVKGSGSVSDKGDFDITVDVPDNLVTRVLDGSNTNPTEIARESIRITGSINRDGTVEFQTDALPANFLSVEVAESPVVTSPSSESNPEISGTPSVGRQLTSTTGSWSGFGITGFTYQWKRDGTNISGATNQTYVVVSADDGTVLTVEVTATNSAGSTSATSAGVTVNFTGPALVTSPSISGTNEIGQVLTASNGTWTGGGITYTYEWRRGTAAISGATSQTYTLVAADDLASITCAVTATNTGGSRTVVTPSVSVTYPAPTATGGLADRTYDENSGTYTVSTASDFTGSNLTYALTTSQAGVSINASTAVVTIDTGLTGSLSAASVVVQATNSGGSITSAFSLTVTADSTVEDVEYDAAVGLSPQFLLDETEQDYRLAATSQTYPWDIVENNGATDPSDMATLLDDDGDLKWPQHNLDPRVGSGATSFTLELEANYEHTVAFIGTGTATLTGGTTQTLNGTGASDVVSVTFTPTADVSVSLSGTVDEFHAYRSDLAGMQANGASGNPTYLPAPSGRRFTLGRHYGYQEGEVFVGKPVFEASENVVTYADPGAFWGSPWNDTGATSAAGASGGALGNAGWTGRQVISGGQEWHRIDTQGGTLISMTADTPVAFQVVYSPGTSEKTMFQIRESVSQDTSRLGGPINNVEEVLSETGSFSSVTDTGYPDGRILRFIFTPSVTASYELGFGPFSTTSGEHATLWFVQMERKTVHTPLMPFSGTRPAPAPTRTYSSLGLGSAVTLMVDASVGFANADSSVRTLLALDDGDANDQITLQVDASGSTTNVAAEFTSGGTTSDTLTQASSGPIRSAVTYASGEAALNADNAAAVWSTSVVVPTVTTLRIGHSLAGEYLNGYIEKIGGWPDKINETDLASLTSLGMPGTNPQAASLPVNSVAPTVTGTPTAGQTLTASQGTWTGTLRQTFTYQWLRNQSPISGATSSSYTTVDPTDIDQTIVCQVTSTNVQGSVSALSNAVVVGDPADIPAPVNIEAPLITGSSNVGSTLTCSQGTWSDDVDSYSYQWLRNDVAISGATSATYTTVDPDDVDLQVTCRVTATNAGGSTNQQASNTILVKEASGDFASMSYVPARAMTAASKWAGQFVGSIGWSALTSGASIVEIDSLAAHESRSGYNVPEYSGGTTVADAVSCRPYPEGPISTEGSLVFAVPMKSGRVIMRNRFPHFTRGHCVFAGHMAPAPGLEFHGQQQYVAGQKMWLDGGASRPDRQTESESVARNTDSLAIRSYEDGARDLGDKDQDTEDVIITQWSAGGSADEGITFKALNGNEMRRVTLKHFHMFQPLDNPGRDANERPHTLSVLVQKGCYLIDISNGYLIGLSERGPKVEGGHNGAGTSVAVNGVVAMCFNDGGSMRSELARNRGDSVRQSNMSLNLWDFAKGDIFMSATRSIGLWPSDRFLFDHPSGNHPTHGYRGKIGGLGMGSDSSENYQVYAHQSECYMRDYSLNDALVAAASPRDFSSDIPWWNNVTDANTEIVSREKSWDPSVVSGGLSDTERFNRKYSGKFPAARDALDELAYEIAFDPDQDRLLPRLDRLPGPNGTDWEDYNYPEVTRTVPHPYPDDPWEIVNDVPRLFRFYDEIYRQPAGCVPMFED